MALDYIIGGLQLISAAVNALALGAFWISPGLRTTANRFAINLLIANIVACISLTPAFWLNGGLVNHSLVETTYFEPSLQQAHQSSEPFSDATENIVRNLHPKFQRDLRRRVEDVEHLADYRDTIVEVVRDSKGNIVEYVDQVDIIEEINEPEAVPVKIQSDQQIDDQGTTIPTAYTLFTANALKFDCVRFWGFDFAASIGVLSVILVVFDTWCAVTDPLRYHSRISYLKSWILIATIWVVSLLLGAISAFRTRWCTIEQNGIHMHIGSVSGFIESNSSLYTANIYGLAFSSFYFTMIILVPFVVVCVMYWKIFSEARQSGQRMRRNGSSPLLQSSLNLNTCSTGVAPNPLNDNQRYPSLFDVTTADAITMKIDGKSCERRRSITPVPTHQYRRYLDLPESEQFTDSDRTKSDKNANGLKPKLPRNFSARQLVDGTSEVPTFLTKSCNIGRMITSEMRQVHSSPNLQRLANLDILQKYPYCLNDHSATSISQASQQQQPPTKALSYMISIRHRLSNASSIFKYREESRAARIGIVVVGIFLISYIPYGLSILLQGRVTFIANASLCHILLLLVANITLPFVFAYRNRRVRRGVCRLFGIDTKSNDYLQNQRMQLRGQSNGHAKRVRIHRNLSASNFSLNMLPYKFAAQSMLPIQAAKVDETIMAGTYTGNASILVPIDDVESEGADTVSPLNGAYDTHRNASADVHDINNNSETPTKLHKDKLSLFHLMRGNTLRKSMSVNRSNDMNGDCNAAKGNIV